MFQAQLHLCKHIHIAFIFSEQTAPLEEFKMTDDIIPDDAASLQ